MSGDSLPDPSSRAADPGIDSTALKKPKQRYRKLDETDATAGTDALTLLSAWLQNALRQDQGDDQNTAARSKVNRFSPRVEAGGNAAPAFPGNRTPDSTVVFRPRPARSNDLAGHGDVRAWQPGRWARGVLCVALFAAAVGAAAFLAGRRDALRALPAPAPWQPVFVDRWAKAHSAEQAGDLAAALRITQDVAAHVSLDPMSRVYQATLKTRLGYTVDAETDLFRQLGPGLSPEAATAINTARAFNQVRARKFHLANDCFADVAVLSPDDTINLLNWAESLRREGRFTDAADRFDEVLTRLPTAAALPYVAARRAHVAYERRLALIEAGRDDELRAEVGPRTSASAPDGYWLLTAAAIALQQGDMPPAVEAMEKARAAFPREQFDALLADYFFRSFAYHPEMNIYQPLVTPEQEKAWRSSMDYFIDP